MSRGLTLCRVGTPLELELNTPSSNLPRPQQSQETRCGTNEIRTLERLVAHFLQ
jgi:hypothetical protein